MKGYDYAQPGVYFVTICVQGRENLFGTVIGGEMQLNGGGQMVGSWWRRLPDKFPTITIDEFAVMPNHIHGVIIIVEPDDTVGANPRVRPESGQGQTHGSAPTLGKIMQWFKTMTTNAYIRGVKQDGWKPFLGKLWQRNYYERIVRNERELNAVRQYIQDNPVRWTGDQENLERCPA